MASPPTPLSGIAALAFYLSSIKKLGVEWAFWVGLGLIALLILMTVISVVALPFAWRAQLNARRKIGTAMREMATAYGELRTAGPISADRIHELVTAASAKGVAWPPPLYTLLEDIRSRGGRF